MQFKGGLNYYSRLIPDQMRIQLKLNQRKSKETTNGFPLIIYVTHNYKEKEWSTGYCAKRSQWSMALAAPTKKHPNFYNFANYVKDMKVKINTLHLEATKRYMPFDEIKEKLFVTRTNSFYETVYGSFEPDYRGTDWSAVITVSYGLICVSFRFSTDFSNSGWIRT